MTNQDAKVLRNLINKRVDATVKYYEQLNYGQEADYDALEKATSELDDFIEALTNQA